MPALLEVNQLTKRFPGVVALDNISLAIEAGEVHALVGENGAGKSTLVKVLTGVLTPDAGEIRWKEQWFSSLSPAQVRELGISTIYQETSLVPSLSVGENVFLGRLPGRSRGLVDWGKMNESARKLLSELGTQVAPTVRVSQLNTIDQRMVEVARSLSARSDLIIMDEPTAALGAHEISVLFNTIRRLRERGVAVLYISHFLEEVFEVSDRITVLRDGRLVGTVKTGETSAGDIVYMMAGRRISMEEQDKRSYGDEVLLRSVHLTRDRAFYDVSFELHAGEILGLSGPVNSGRMALARALFGIQPAHSGQVWYSGQQIQHPNPSRVMQQRVGLVPRNRHREGLLVDASIARNVALPSWNRLSRFGLVSAAEEGKLGQRYIERLSIKSKSVRQLARYLSGGNQQKVVISKWLAIAPRVLILDEPTQGIDVAAKEEIYHVMRDLARQGIGILFISSEPGELARLCHRVMIIRRGRIQTTLVGDEITPKRIIEQVTGAGKA